MSLYGIDRDVQIRDVRNKTKHKNKRVVRRIVAKLIREFDGDMADAIGGDARAVLEGVSSGGIDKAVMDIGALKVHGAFTATNDGAKDACAIEVMVGVKAVASRGEGDDDPPEVALTFELAWNEAAWAFLGRHSAGVSTVMFTEAQGQLPFSDEVGDEDDEDEDGESAAAN